MAILTGSITGLSLNGGSRALNASYAGKTTSTAVLAVDSGHWAAIHENFFGLLLLGLASLMRLLYGNF